MCEFTNPGELAVYKAAVAHFDQAERWARLGDHGSCVAALSITLNCLDRLPVSLRRARWELEVAELAASVDGDESHLIAVAAAERATRDAAELGEGNLRILARRLQSRLTGDCAADWALRSSIFAALSGRPAESFHPPK